MRKFEGMKKVLSAVLAFSMVLSYAPVTAFAVTEDGSCEHHAHDESCGYVAMVEGVDCGHECSDACKTKQVTGCIHNHETEGCTYTPAAEAVACDYVHGEGCNHVYAQDEVLCTCGAEPQHTAECASVLTEGADCDCTMPVTHAGGCNPQAAVAESCDHVHGECAYREAVKESWSCGHVCSVETGCITFACAHVCPEDNCGFAAAVEGSDCEYVCSECDPQPDSGDVANAAAQTVDFMDYLEDPLAVMFQSAEDIDLHDYLVNAYGVPAEIPFTCEPATVAYGEYADGDTFSLTVTAGEGYEGSCTVEAEVYHAGNIVDYNTPCEMKIYIRDDATKTPVKNVLITLKHKTRPNYANYDKVHEWTTDDDGGLQSLGYNVEYVYTDVLVEFAGNDAYPRQSYTVTRTKDDWDLQTAYVYLKPYRSASVTVKNEHGEAVTDANVTVGGTRLNHQGNGAYSNSKAVYGSSQKLTITAPGYVGKEATVTVGGGGYTGSYTLECNEPDILVNGTAAGSTLNLPTGSTYALTFQNPLPSGAQKSRSGTSSNHFSWVETGNGWNATPTTLTENGSLTFQYTHGENRTHTKTYSVKITKGSTASPAAPNLSGNTNTVTTETFKLPADLKLAQSLTITATGAVNKTQTFTGLTPGKTLTMPLSNTPVKGTVTYQFSYKSDVVSYNTTPSASQSYTQILTEEMFQLSWSSAPYNGENQRPEVSVVSGAGISLDQCDIKYGCWVRYPWQKDGIFVEAGAIRPTPFTEYVQPYNIPLITEAYVVQLTAKEGSDYTGSVMLNYHIQKLKAGEVTPLLEYSETTYDGTAKTPKVWLECSGGKKLEIGTVSYGQNNTDAGTVNVSLSNYGDYIDGTINWQGSFKITQRPLWGKVTDVNKDYDGTNTKRATFSLENVADKDKNTITGLCDVIYPSENAGTYSITVENFSDSEQLKDNYYLDAEKITYPEKGTINPRKVTVRADAKSKTYGEADPELTYTVDNIVENETLTGINVSRKEGEAAGDYIITVTADENANPNYAITPENGTFTINPKTIGIEWGNTTLTYNRSEQAPTATATDIVNGDAITLTVDGAKTNAGTDYTATVTGITGDKAGNYKLPTNVTTTFEIKNASQTAPTVTGGDETIADKADGKITGVDSTMEYRKDGETEYTAISGTEVTALPAGTYYVRYAAKENYDASPDTAVEIKAGRMLIVTIPAVQTGYTLTANLTEVKHRGSVILTYSLAAGYTEGEDFAVTATNCTITNNENNTYTLSDITDNVVVSVTGVQDVTAPTANINITTNNWNAFLNAITFEKYFNATQTVTITANDEGSGVNKIYYYLASEAMTLEQVQAIKDWTEYSEAFSIDPDNQYVIYAKAVDNDGNTIWISSEGIVLDKTTPTITGVTNNGVYYTTQKVTAADNTTLDTLTLNGTSFDGTIPSNPAQETNHTIVATDKAGNSTTFKIVMKPIESLAEGLPTTVTVKLEDKADIQDVLDTVNNILNYQSENATEEELEELADIKADCEKLLEEIQKAENVIALIVALPEPAKVEPDDKNTIDAYDAALAAYNALSDTGKRLVGEDNTTKLNKVGNALIAYKITKGDGSKWTKSSGKTLEFTANGYYADYGSYVANAYGKFVYVEIDGKILDTKNYTAKAGSTVITLNASYLETLSLGKHTIQVFYTDGETNVATFRVYSTGSNPLTGDEMNLMLFGGVAMASLLCMAMMVMFIPRKKGKYTR